MVGVCMVGSPGGRHATTCMRRLQDNFMELVLPSAFTWVPGLNLCPQPCRESSFTTKPSCWPLQSFSKAMLQYCYTGKWSLKLVQSTFNPQPSRLSLICGCVAWILLLNECVLLLGYCWFGTFLCISLDNSSIFQAFACDKCSQLYKKLSGFYLLSLSSQGASSESSITLLAFVLLEFLFESYQHVPLVKPWEQRRMLLCLMNRRPWDSSGKNLSAGTCQSFPVIIMSCWLSLTLSCLGSFGDQYNQWCLARILWPRGHNIALLSQFSFSFSFKSRNT